MRRKWLGGLAVWPLLFLPACFLDRMEENMKETNRYVQSTNVKIEETKEGQVLGLAFEVVGDKRRERSYRITSAETLIVKGKDDRIWKYFGIPNPIGDATATRRLEGNLVTFPNVTLVGQEEDWDLGVNCASRSLYGIISFAAGNLPLQYLKKSSRPGLTAEEKESIHTDVKRLAEAVPAILGASPVQEVKKIALFDLLAAGLISDKQKVAELSEQVWAQGMFPPNRPLLMRERRGLQYLVDIANQLEQLAVNANFTESETDRMRTLIEVKLGLQRHQGHWQ